jgi:hypothetical protein
MFCFSLFSDSCSISSADLGIPKLQDQCLGKLLFGRTVCTRTRKRFNR